MEQILSTQIYKFTACLLKLSFFSFLHHVLKVSWDVSEERAAYFIVTESSSANTRVITIKAFLCYIIRWGVDTFGRLRPQKGEEGIGLVTSQQESRVSIRDVQVY